MLIYICDMSQLIQFIFITRYINTNFNFIETFGTNILNSNYITEAKNDIRRKRHKQKTQHKQNTVRCTKDTFYANRTCTCTKYKRKIT